MSTNTGVACQCNTCAGPKWYDDGKCQGCRTNQRIEFTWIAAGSGKGGSPPAAPKDELYLESGACNQLLHVWTDLVFVRALSPHVTPGESMPARETTISYSSPERGWYVKRGVAVAVKLTVPSGQGFAEKLNRVGGRTNQSLLVRVMATFEAFAGGGRMGDFRLPNKPGMREFHHARRLRNKIAHGDPLKDQRLLDEAQELLGPQAVENGSCTLDIALVLEPLWARLLLYAWSLEDGLVVPAKPAVVVGADDASSTVQTFEGMKAIASSGARRDIGDVIPLCDTA